MAVQIQIRRDTAAAWTAANPVLAQGELGWETDTFRAKVGDGSTAWNSLAYRFEGVGGGGSIAVEHDNASVDATVSTLDFGHGLDAASEDATEVNVTIDETELDFSTSNMNIGKSFQLSGDIAATITGNTDNWAPSGLADASIILITTNTPGFNLTGITGGADGRVLLLVNLAASFLLTLKHDQTSTAANRFLLPGSQDLQLDVNQSVLAVYDSSASRWRVIGDLTLSNVNPSAIGTAAPGVSNYASRSNHIHPTGAGTPSTQAFGDSPTIGSGPAASMTDHKHGFPAFPVDVVSAETLALQGDISDTIAANQDNYTPSGLADATILRITPSGATRTITGITGGADGRVLIVENVGSQILILAHDVTSTAANRFFCPGSINLQLDTNTAALCVYDATASRWRVIGQLVLGTNSPNPVGTAAAGTAAQASHQDHVHPTGASTPVTQAFGDAATTGSGPAASMTDHRHGMPTDPTTDLTVDETLALLGDITDTSTGAQDNWAPTGLADATVIRWNGASTITLSGITGGADGRMLILMNVTSAQLMTLLHDQISTAGNRFTLPAAQSFGVNAGAAAILVYDATASRWRVMSHQILTTTAPLPIGTQAVGTALTAARNDHVHAFPTTSTLGHLVVDDSASFTDIISDSTTGSVNNWAPTGIGTAFALRWTGASALTVTGLADQGAGRLLLLIHTAAGTADMTLKHLDGASSSANQFICPNSEDFHLGPREHVFLFYDESSGQWRVIAPLYKSNATPLVESGAGSAGTSTGLSRDDHVHPTGGGGAANYTTVWLYS